MPTIFLGGAASLETAEIEIVEKKEYRIRKICREYKPPT
jgi:hypothetical protein